MINFISCRNRISWESYGKLLCFFQVIYEADKYAPMTSFQLSGSMLTAVSSGHEALAYEVSLFDLLYCFVVMPFKKLQSVLITTKVVKLIPEDGKMNSI